MARPRGEANWQHMLGRAANILLRRLGYELRPQAAPPVADHRASHRGILRNARLNGLRPRTVIDVGAAFGGFTRDAAHVFPDAEFVLVEPLEEYSSHLASTLRDLPGRPALVRAAAGATSGAISFNVHRDLVGSSMLREREASGVNGIPRTVPVIGLDDEIGKRDAAAPYLLKVDVQGAELQVLSGASRVLAGSDFVMLEVSFFDFFEGGASIADVIRYMDERAFTVYDATLPLYRPLDGALAQMDLCFVKRDGDLRRQHAYATAEQRRAQDQRMSALSTTKP